MSETHDGFGQGEPPFTFALDAFPGIIDDDELLFHGLARQIIVVLARETIRAAGDVSEQRTVVSQERLRRLSRDPIRALEGQVHAFVALLEVIRAESGSLQVLPVNHQFAAPLIYAIPQFPEMLMLPRGDGRHFPGPKGTPIVGEVFSEDRITLVEAIG